MAVAVQTITDGGWATSIDPNVAITITKPASLAVGDLMVAVLMHGGSSTGVTTVTATDWTNEFNTTQLQNHGIWFLYKVATAGDVAASDFTFTTNHDGTGTGKIGGCILRIDGQAQATFEQSTGGTTSNADSVNVSVGSLSLTPTYNNSLLILAIGGANAESGATTVSAQAINGTNPSWTERIDISNVDGGDTVFSVSTGVLVTAAQITTLTATLSNLFNDHYAAVLVIPPLLNASVTLDLISLAGTPNAFTVTGAANVTLDQIALTATPNDVTAAEAVPKWSNVDKSSPSTFTNVDKS